MSFFARGTSGSNAVVKPTAVTEPTDMVSTVRARSTDGEKQQGTARRLRYDILSGLSSVTVFEVSTFSYFPAGSAVVSSAL